MDSPLGRALCAVHGAEVGAAVAGVDTARVKALIFVVSAVIASLVGPLSVEDNLCLGAYRRSGRDVADKLEKMYAMFPILKEKRKDPAGTTIFLVEQNAFAALGICDRGYVLETGEVKIAGPGAALLADDRVCGAYLGI